jgi:hypothetical protein
MAGRGDTGLESDDQVEKPVGLPRAVARRFGEAREDPLQAFPAANSKASWSKPDEATGQMTERGGNGALA